MIDEYTQYTGEEPGFIRDEDPCGRFSGNDPGFSRDSDNEDAEEDICRAKHK